MKSDLLTKESDNFESTSLTHRENVCSLVVELPLQALGRHPVGRPDLRQPMVRRLGYLGGQAEITHDDGEVALLRPLHEHIL